MVAAVSVLIGCTISAISLHKIDTKVYENVNFIAFCGDGVDEIFYLKGND